MLIIVIIIFVIVIVSSKFNASHRKSALRCLLGQLPDVEHLDIQMFENQ